jgi:hypothetical protein
MGPFRVACFAPPEPANLDGMRNGRRVFRVPARGALALLAALASLSAGAEAALHLTRAFAQGGLSPSSFQLVWSSGALADQGQPIAESSPVEAALDGSGPSVVVGDRAGYLYAYHLSDGSAVNGWPARVVSANGSPAPVDSTPSVAMITGSSFDSVFVGAGDAGNPNAGGYYAFSPSGQQLWHSNVLLLGHAATGVQASLTVANLQGTTAVAAGSLGQLAYALNASSGQVLSGWPFFAADSIFSTAAAADLFGTGQTELVVGGASTSGLAVGQAYPAGGHVRVLDANGNLLYDYDTNQEVDSSPAVGDFLSGGQPGIVVGTGSYYHGASDTDTLKAFTTRLQLVWSDTLAGATTSSPALADVFGNGETDVVEGTDAGGGGAGSGSVYVLDGATGATIWDSPVAGRVIGSVVVAALSGAGPEDLLVPTTQGVEVFACTASDTCSEVTVLAGGRGDPGGQYGTLGFQNSPLVTADPGGTAGITIAGYDGHNQGVVEHFEVAGSSGATAVGAGTWPMFHHDAQLTGAAAPLPDLGRVTPTGLSAQAGNGQVTLSWSPPSGSASPVTGYDLYQATTPGHEGTNPVNGPTPITGDTYTVTGLSNGTRYYFYLTAVNSAGEGGPSPPATTVPFGPPAAPLGLAATAGDGEVTLSWAAPASDGGSAITGYDVYESTAAGTQGTQVATTSGTGYTVSGLTNGTTYYFEVTAVNAAGQGQASAQVTAVPVATAPAAPGGPPSSPGSPGSSTTTTTTTAPPPPPAPVGYRMVTTGGQVFAFGKVPPSGAGHPAAPVVGVAAAPGGRGYWLAESNGAVMAGGDARLYGTLAGRRLTKPVVGIASTPDGRGYWLVASDGGIFAFGDARFYGSTGHLKLNKPIVGIASTPDGRGYWLVASDGGIFAFGDARFYGSTGHLKLNKPIVGIASTPDGRGYWLVASDGGIFAFGKAGYYGSLSGRRLAGEVVGIAP